MTDGELAAIRERASMIAQPLHEPGITILKDHTALLSEVSRLTRDLAVAREVLKYWKLAENLEIEVGQCACTDGAWRKAIEKRNQALAGAEGGAE